MVEIQAIFGLWATWSCLVLAKLAQAGRACAVQALIKTEMRCTDHCLSLRQLAENLETKKKRDDWSRDGDDDRVHEGDWDQFPDDTESGSNSDIVCSHISRACAVYVPQIRACTGRVSRVSCTCWSRATRFLHVLVTCCTHRARTGHVSCTHSDVVAHGPVAIV